MITQEERIQRFKEVLQNKEEMQKRIAKLKAEAQAKAEARTEQINSLLHRFAQHKQDEEQNMQ